MNIFIVEDDSINLKLIKEILSNTGHVIHECDNAEKAYDNIRSLYPDIILMDLVLPDYPGTELAIKIKNDESIQDIPIIAITAYPERFRQRDIVVSGFDAYISKPINTRILVDMIEGLAPKRHSKAG